MDEKPEPPPGDPKPQAGEPAGPSGEQSGGINVGGGSVEAGRDIAGRDVIRHEGLPAAEVRRLLITVGAMVFFTAACFFSGGVVLGGAAIAAINRPVASSEAAAASMARKLEAVDRLRPGQRAVVVFTEDEISSYVRFRAGPQMDLRDGRVRLLDEPGRLVVTGEWGAFPRIAATFRLEGESPHLKLDSAAAQVIAIQDSTFGWVAVPNFVVEPVAAQVNERLFRDVRVESVARIAAAERTWGVTLVKR